MNELDTKFIGSVLGLYESLQEQGIVLVYVGKFNHKIINMFTAITEEETDIYKESKAFKRRLHHSVVEILQNITMHSTHLFHKIKFGKGLFMLGRKKSSYYVFTANRILKKEIPKLKNAIEEVNNCTLEELRNLYKKKLKVGILSKKGGAGLGLIDIARTSKNKLGFTFLPIDKKHNYFILKVQIDA